MARNKVLVLNNTYEVIGQTGVRRAVALYLAGKVEILEIHSGSTIRSERLQIPAPAVVRFRYFIPLRSLVPYLTKRNLFIRDNGECQYCKTTLSYDAATIDHVIPRSRGGKNTWENMVTCCRRCNFQKESKTLAEWGGSLVKIPKRPAASRIWVLKNITTLSDVPDIWRKYFYVT